MSKILNQILRISVAFAGVMILFILMSNPVALIIAIILFFVSDSFLIAFIAYFLSSYAIKRILLFINNNTQLEKTPFFYILFTLLGTLAKADGHVSKEEIKIVESVFIRFKLTDEQKKHAIDLFNQGKSEDFIIDEFINVNFKRIKFLKIRFVLFEILYITALSDGEISSSERLLLEKISVALRIPVHFINSLNERLKSSNNQSLSLSDCYKLLGVNPSCSQTELKIAYRKLIKKNHPDVMLSKGLPKEMIVLATEKTAEINKAYHQIIKEKYS